MPSIDGVQDYNAIITWAHDWTKHLTLNGRTIVTADVTSGNPAAQVISTDYVTTPGVVLFRLHQSGLAAPTVVTLATQVTLDNGDVDVRTMRIQFTNT